ncbi:B12-binding domain-containing radical SAM protein [Dissulfurispira sp.]|uniref:B12-binding domain-containing radical SAM protein n=1 Tax=Dissulfurispira sp. TaxID=2817609 RepID=UPI003FA592D8
MTYPPALDLLPMNEYKISPDMRTGDKLGVILTSRGCPFDCIFCSNRLLTGKKYRMHSIERVCSEIENLIKNYGVTQLFVQDDNFAVNKERAKSLCREMIRRELHKKISWWAEARVDCVDEELLFLMAQANCKIISYHICPK